ncbi:MAG: type I restriction-modification system subunit M [Candidatus Omnitrophica bacterium]|nr:type I restriction-modification system subunit M [Candidatus Omnitrophota bacterium]
MAIKKSQLYSSIWQACDELRGGMDASEYKDYVLVLLFVRYVSDKYAGKKDELVVVPEGGSFADLVKLKGKTNIGEGINKVLSALAEANGLKGVIDAVDFNDEDKLGKGKEMQDRLSNLVAIFENSELDFSKNKAEGDDLLGDAYEYLMKHFAVESGKSKGQFYTPAEVSRIIAKVIGAKDAKGKTHTVYDPTCGSGSLLLKVAAETPKGIAIFGQEKENATATLAILNMWLHGEPTAEIKKGQSTLSNPLFVDQHSVLKTFDYVVANPPFSYKAWRNGFNPEEDPHGRFEGFGIPPKKNGDFAFLLHIVKSLKSTGKGAVILPHGVLFRGNTEADIRKALIQRGYIKGVIGLPANLFYGTGIPACIIVIDKEDSAKRTGIFMIDASKGFIKDGNKNRLREQDIRKVVDVWNDQLEIPKYSRFVPNDEIKKNEYNLNIPRYIDTQEPEDIQDIEGHLKGGIPNADIDALEEYWKVCPTLKKALLKPSRSGYCTLAITPDEVRKTIFSHSEFATFRVKIIESFTSWRKDTAVKLAGIDTKDHPKAIIQKISDDILKVFQDAHLLDKYDIYQCLMSYWEDVMQDDTHIITADGWQAGNEVIRLQKDSKGKKKDIEGLSGLEGRLIPVPLMIKTYFPKEQTEIDELNTKIEQTVSKMDELKDEHGGEDGLLSEVIENDKIKKGDVGKRIKEIKGDADYTDELKVLKQYADLFDEEAEFKKKLKEAEAALEKKVIAKYPTLALKEIKSLVVESKWVEELQSRVIGEVDKLSQRLAGRVKELSERYSEPLTMITQEISKLTKKVKGHLAKMGFILK